jgi:hypothetical protein
MRHALQVLPERAVALTEDDGHTFALWYGIDVLGERQDTVVVDTRLWGFRPYVSFVQNRVGRTVTAAEHLGGPGTVCVIGLTGEVNCR